MDVIASERQDVTFCLPTACLFSKSGRQVLQEPVGHETRQQTTLFRDTSRLRTRSCSVNNLHPAARPSSSPEIPGNFAIAAD